MQQKPKKKFTGPKMLRQAQSLAEVEEIKKKIKPNKADQNHRVLVLDIAIERMKDFKKDLKVDDLTEFLNDEGRHECPSCKKQKKFYCPDCLVATCMTEKVPQVKLPINLAILHHQEEKRGKSSALPLKVVSPNQIEIFETNALKGDEFDPATTLILFPTPDSIEVKKLPEEYLVSAKKVIAIDCTWFQTTGILHKLKDKNFRFVKISDYDTTFWRHQQESSKHLATCEAIYYFYKEFDERYERVVNKKEDYVYDGKVDNLLFYYMLQYYMMERDYQKKLQLPPVE